MLLKKERNEIFNIISKAGLNAIDFEEINSGDYTIRYKENNFVFNILDGDLGYGITGFPSVNYDPYDQRMGSWKDVIKCFINWSNLLKEEVETVDLWAEAQSNAKLFALDKTAPNEMFNGSELRQLEGQVRLLVQGLATLGLPANAQKLLTETVNEIPEKATRFTKKELAGWFMGAFAAQVTALTLSPEHVSAVAQLIKTTFFGLLGLN